jgi:hypothetical protein
MANAFCPSGSMGSVLPQRSFGALQHMAPLSSLDAASSNPSREIRCRRQQTPFQLCFDRSKAGQMIGLRLRLLPEARQCLARTFVRYERTIPRLPDAAM